MKVRELISILEKVNPNAEIQVFDLLHDHQKDVVRFEANVCLTISSEGKPHASFGNEDDGYSFFRIYAQ